MIFVQRKKEKRYIIKDILKKEGKQSLCTYKRFSYFEFRCVQGYFKSKKSSTIMAIKECSINRLYTYIHRLKFILFNVK
jgi:hypothetical protein